jgi:hypothetical protein
VDLLVGVEFKPTGKHYVCHGHRGEWDGDLRLYWFGVEWYRVDFLERPDFAGHCVWRWGYPYPHHRLCCGVVVMPVVEAVFAMEASPHASFEDARRLEFAMLAAAEAAQKEGVTDPDEIRRRMLAVRDSWTG